MSDIPGIQQSSWFVLNAQTPADKKMKLTTIDRLGLTFVQRRLGMIVYDQDLDQRKQLATNPTGDVTTETDWVDFGWWTDPAIHKNIIKDEDVIITVPEWSQYIVYETFDFDGGMILDWWLCVM